MRVGDRAPSFEGPDDTGARISLEVFRGVPVVVHFFALAWTGV